MNKLKSIFDLKKFAVTKIAIAVGATLMLSSCLKNNDRDYVEPAVAYTSIFHASPGTDPFNVAIGDRIITSDGFTTRLLFEYPKALTYVRVVPGQRTVSLLKKDTNDSLRTGRFNLVQDKFYSLFVVDAAPNPNFLLIEDVNVLPVSGKAKARFVNLSPDAGNLNLYVTSGTDTVMAVTNTAYKSHSPFSEINATSLRKYKLEIKHGNTSIKTINDVELNGNATYTIWANGLSTATVDSLKTSIKVNQH